MVVAAEPMPCEVLATSNGTKDSAAANTVRINELGNVKLVLMKYT